MYYAKYLAAAMLLLSSCGGMADDLRPSGEDKRPVAQASQGGTTSYTTAADFTAPDSVGGQFNLNQTLAQKKGVVLYFTMWCPICAAHMDHMAHSVAPLFPDVKFVLVDYVSGSVAAARQAEIENGYRGSVYTTIVDIGGGLIRQFGATMGTTVVINSSGGIVLQEDYKDGVAVTRALEVL